MEGPSPTCGVPGPKASPGTRGLQDAPSPGSPPADRHVDLRGGGVLPLPPRQQREQVGQQRVEQGHGEGQDQQDGFPLLPAAAPRTELLLNLAAGTGLSAWLPAARRLREGSEHRHREGASPLPGAALATRPRPPTPGQELPGARQHSPCACAARRGARPARRPAPCPARGPRPAAARRSAPGAGRGCGSASGSAAPPAAPARERCLHCPTCSRFVLQHRAGPRGPKGKVLVWGWSRGHLQLQSPPVQGDRGAEPWGLGCFLQTPSRARRRAQGVRGQLQPSCSPSAGCRCSRTAASPSASGPP